MLLQGRRVLPMVLVLSVIPVVAQTPPMRDGQYEVTLQMSMPNMPQPMPEMKVTQCVTKDQWKDLMGNLSKTGAVPGDTSCKQDEFKLAGNKATWKVSCTGAQPVTIQGENVFDGDTTTGTMNMTTAQGTTMSVKMAAKRIGDCK